MLDGTAIELFLSNLISLTESSSLRNSKLLRAVLKTSSVREQPLVFNDTFSSFL